MSTYQDAIDSINSAIVALADQRQNVAGGTSASTTLDEDITYLQNKRDQINTTAVQNALDALQDENALQNLQNMTADLNAAVASIANTANVLGQAATIVSIATGLVSLILPLV